MRIRQVLPTVLLGSLMFAPALPAQTPAPPKDNVRAVLEMLRSDFNTLKIATINEVMRLTGPEAEKFWPIYRDYEKELAEVGDRKLELIRDFAARHRAGTLDDAGAKTLAEKWLDVTGDRLELWKKYNQRISRAVSPLRGAQFLQVEHQMALFVDINIASEMPLIGRP